MNLSSIIFLLLFFSVFCNSLQNATFPSSEGVDEFGANDMAIGNLDLSMILTAYEANDTTGADPLFPIFGENTTSVPSPSQSVSSPPPSSTSITTSSLPSTSSPTPSAPSSVTPESSTSNATNSVLYKSLPVLPSFPPPSSTTTGISDSSSTPALPSSVFQESLVATTKDSGRTCPLYNQAVPEMSFCLYLIDATDSAFHVIPPSSYFSFFWPKLVQMVSPVCGESVSSYGFSYFFIDQKSPPRDVLYFCCPKIDCGGWSRDDLDEAILHTAAVFPDVTWDDRLALTAQKGCIDTDGFLQKSFPNSETCIFHANAKSMTAGPLQVGQFASRWDDEGNRNDRSSHCWLRMAVDDFEVMCCCYGNVADCATVARSLTHVSTAFLFYGAIIEGRPRIRPPANEVFGAHTFHCAMMRVAEGHNGSYSLEGTRGEVQYIGGSTCGVVFTMSPDHNDSARFSMEFRAGSFNSFCFHITNSAPIYIEPSCPFDVAPGVHVRILYCCQGHYCNHPKLRFPQLDLLSSVEGTRFLTPKQCPVTYPELMALFVVTDETGLLCEIHFDPAKNQTVSLIENVNMMPVAEGAKEEFSFRTTESVEVNATCYLHTIRFVLSSDCPHHQTYEPVDSPIREIFTCAYFVPDLKSETFEVEVDMAEMYAKFQHKYECTAFNGYLRAYSSGDVDAEASHSRVCYFKLGYSGHLTVQAGSVIIDSEDVEQDYLYELYLEHFVSQRRPDGVLVTFDKRANAVYFLCTSSENYCNFNEAATDLASRVLMVNFKRSEMDFGWTCQDRECEVDLGCFRVESLSSSSTKPEAGCISEIPRVVRQKPQLGFLLSCYAAEPDLGCSAAVGEGSKEVLVFCCCRFACQEEIYDNRKFWAMARESTERMVTIHREEE
ncbi:hypothetical protein QR680_016944 [Steinernema hermaphroditum]|uniref:Uncharacterized protein n=1 Tax=Steinernema hermaphroditum TaxID=289476 RepID=A0AA39HDR9_9BILA|nr:hypothetical protein QR680_016944 [Steinernema hermaphroditum]